MSNNLYEMWWSDDWDEINDEPGDHAVKLGTERTAFAALQALPELAMIAGREYGAGYVFAISCTLQRRQQRAGQTVGNELLASPLPTLGVVAEVA